MNLRFLTAADVVTSLPMAEAIKAVKDAYVQLSAGQAAMPLRSHIEVRDGGTALVMPAYLPQQDALAVKVVNVFPQNAVKQLPVIHALVLVIDTKTGRPRAILEGGSLTAIRTGAASGAATDVLAREDAATAAIIGSGVQARTQLEAVCTVRSIRQASVFSLNRPEAEKFAEEMAGKGPIPRSISVADRVEAAIAGADIICTATTSSTPVFDGELVKAGTHINGVGSFTPTMQELDLATVQRSLVIVDSREAVWEEAGDLIIPLQSGDIEKEHVAAELGEVIAGKHAGRTRADQITFFKSVGLAVQDAATAKVVLGNALVRGLGTIISL